MPDYVLNCEFVDEIQGVTTRRYEATLADDAAAATAATNLLTDLGAATTAAINPQLIKKLSSVGTAASGSRVFENARIVVMKNDGEEYPMDLPSPEAAVFTAGTNTVDITAGVVTDLIANFSSSLWKISDGEYPTAILRGKRVFLRSGKTNLK